MPFPLHRIMLLAAVAGALAVPLAIAHDREFTTRAAKPVRSATTVPTKHKYTGRVTSPKPACMRRRQVILEIEGTPISKSTRTRRNGRWGMQLATPASDYEVNFTVVFKDLDPSREHKHVCKAVVRTYPYPGTDPEGPVAERG